MISLSKKSAVFEDSVIRRMTRICNEYGALNLSQGFPDFNPPYDLLAKLEDTAFKGPHQYAITWGADNFRKALSQKVEHFSGLSYDPQSEITVTCGSTEAMLASVLATLNDGDKVAIFSPFYENYGADAILCGATPIYIPLHEPSFDFNDAELEQAFNGLFKDGKTKVLVECVELEYISSAGLRVLLAAAKQFKKVSGEIALAGLSQNVKQVFEISGFTSIFPIYATREEALANM